MEGVDEARTNGWGFPRQLPVLQVGVIGRRRRGRWQLSGQRFWRRTGHRGWRQAFLFRFRRIFRQAFEAAEGIVRSVCLKVPNCTPRRPDVGSARRDLGFFTFAGVSPLWPLWLCGEPFSWGLLHHQFGAFEPWGRAPNVRVITRGEGGAMRRREMSGTTGSRQPLRGDASPGAGG